jgi:hypothetical protein
MSNIKPFAGIEIPFELEDLLTPLIPYIESIHTDSSPNTKTRIRIQFYFPTGIIRYDAEAMQKYFDQIEIEIVRRDPVYSWTDPYEPIIPAKRIGERVTCYYSKDEHTRTEKQTRTTERAKEPTNDSSEDSKRQLSFPPQRFA